jgi:hypothetical protein
LSRKNVRKNAICGEMRGEQKFFLAQSHDFAAENRSVKLRGKFSCCNRGSTSVTFNHASEVRPAPSGGFFYAG